MTTTSYGALVGWTSDDLNDRIMLRLESFDAQDHRDPDDIHTHHLLMTKNQAVLLSNYLLKQIGEAPPAKTKRGFFRRLLV